MIKKIKKTIKNEVKRHFDEKRIMGRFEAGDKDLQKGLHQGQQISKEQEEAILEFWKPYLSSKMEKKTFDPRWFNIYNKTNVFGHDLRFYIPDSYQYCILDPFLNKTRECRIIDDKNMYDLYFPDAPMPRTICRKNHELFLDPYYNIISVDEAVRLCAQEGKVIIKRSKNSAAGDGIQYWDINVYSKDKLREMLLSKDVFIVQEIIQQHKILASFCDSCVNTFRLITLLFNDTVHVVSAVMIMGGKGAKTNHLHRGGIVCGIYPDGRLRDTAFDGKLNVYQTHPNGMKFSDVVIPNYDKCVALVKKYAPRLVETAHFIGWDLTLDHQGHPILIEPNMTLNGSVQIAAGPTFGELTPQVLEFYREQKTI